MSPNAAPRPAIAVRDAGIGALEASIVIERQQRRLFVMQHVVDLLYVVEHVALRYEQVLPAVVVEVLEAYTPAGACCADSRPRPACRLR